MGRDSARPSSGNFEILDSFFDVVNEIGRARAVYDPMIERERQGNYCRRKIQLVVNR